MKYSLWTLNHESIYICYAEKVKDTNSSKVVEKWMEEGGEASFFREENELNADYVQFFTQD